MSSVEYTHAVTAPAGKLAVLFEDVGGKQPHVQMVKEDSPLKGQVEPGWALVSLDGIDVSYCDKDQVVELLKQRADKERALVFVGLKPSSAPPPEFKDVRIAVKGGEQSKLGVIFDAPDEQVPPTLSGVKPDSPFICKVLPGAQLLAIEKDDVSGLTWAAGAKIFDEYKKSQAVVTLTWRTPVFGDGGAITTNPMQLDYISFPPRFFGKGMAGGIIHSLVERSEFSGLAGRMSGSRWELLSEITIRVNEFLRRSQLKVLSIDTCQIETNSVFGLGSSPGDSGNEFLAALEFTRRFQGKDSNCTIYSFPRIWFDAWDPQNLRPQTRMMIDAQKQVSQADTKQIANNAGEACSIM